MCEIRTTTRPRYVSPCCETIHYGRMGTNRLKCGKCGEAFNIKDAKEIEVTRLYRKKCPERVCKEDGHIWKTLYSDGAMCTRCGVRKGSM